MWTRAPGRLTKPLIRQNGTFREATWDEALSFITRRMTEIKSVHGPDALAFVASSKCTNEEAYLMQKLARAVIGTNNIDNCSRYCQSPATKGLTQTVGLAGGTLTYRSNGIKTQVPDTFVEISPELARQRGIKTGNLVKLISRYGELEVRVLVTDRVNGMEVYMPVNSSENRVNLLTGSHADHVTHTPAYKENSVRMVRLDGNEKSPLPLTDHRFAQRTPQKGVEVERKWKRSDYRTRDT